MQQSSQISLTTLRESIRPASDRVRRRDIGFNRQCLTCETLCNIVWPTS